MAVETYRYGDAFSQWHRQSPQGQGIMEKENYIRILDQTVEQSAEKFKLGDNWKYQQDNDPNVLPEK